MRSSTAPSASQPTAATPSGFPGIQQQGKRADRPDRTAGALRTLTRRAMVERGLSPDFSSAALSEASSIPRAPPRAGGAVRDLRGLPWSSIGDPGAHGLEQLAVAEPLARGAARLLVAVADVDEAVSRGSAIDDHARANTTSLTTAGGTFPMLPENLSGDLTSFAEGRERLAVVVEMVVEPGGTVSRSEVLRAVVVNHCALACDDVAAWLDGATPAPRAVGALARLDAQLRLLDRTARAMRRRRAQRGALDLQATAALPVFERGALTRLRAAEQNRAQDLVEDLLIAASGASASYLATRGFPTFRRTLRIPARWPRLVELAARLGESLPPEPSVRALAGFLASRRLARPGRFSELSLVVTKLLGPGEYAAVPVVQSRKGPRGKFGLAVQWYTHSTAPNRRFPDLVGQRLLKAALRGEGPPYGEEALAALARHCTAREAIAAKIERQILKSAAGLLLRPRAGELFDAVVTGASRTGTWVRIAEPPLEGKLVRGAEGLDVGDELRVQLTHADAERGHLDFARAGERA